MPYFEIEITAKRMVCVQAEDEDEALEIAEEIAGIEWENANARTEDEYDETNPQHAEWIAQYKRQGEFYTAD